MTRTPVAVALLVVLGTVGCSSTGEPGHTSAIDAVAVDADGLTQTVVPATDGFDRVTVTTATYGAAEGVDGVLELRVTGAGEERVSAAAGADIGDNAPVTLAFAPVEGSAGERFTLEFTYAGERPLGLYRNPFDAYADGELAPADGDLTFVLGHGGRVSGAVDALARVVREAVGKATADPLFLVVWALGLAALAVVGVRLRRPSTGRDGASG